MVPVATYACMPSWWQRAPAHTICLTVRGHIDVYVAADTPLEFCPVYLSEIGHCVRGGAEGGLRSHAPWLQV